MPLELELCPGRWVGGQHPCFIIAEIGQNHQGDLDVAKRMIRTAKVRGQSRRVGHWPGGGGSEGPGGRAACAGLGPGCAEPAASRPCPSVPCIRPGVQLSRSESSVSKPVLHPLPSLLISLRHYSCPPTRPLSPLAGGRTIFLKHRFDEPSVAMHCPCRVETL